MGKEKGKKRKIIIGIIIALIIIAAFIYILKGNEKHAEVYSDSMKVYSIIAVFFTFIVFVLWKYAVQGDLKKENTVKVKSDGKEQVDFDGTKIVLAIVIAGFILRLILSVTAPQCDIDTNLFKYWGNMANSDGLLNVYITEKGVRTNVDYPPLYIYVLFVLAKIADIFKLTNTDAYTMLVKLPSIVADCGICLFIYKKYGQNLSKRWLIFFLILWTFNPCVLIDGACWGQVDTILALLLMLTCHYISEKKFFWATLYLTLGIALKPQAIILTPILFYALIKNKKFKPWWQAALTFISGFFLISMPYNIKYGLSPIEIFGKTVKLPWIFSLYIGTTDHYPYTSVNAFNFWFAAGKNWVKDSEKFGSLTFYQWGMAAIVLISVIIWVYYLLAEDKKTLPFVMGATLLSVVVTFGPRMHERYFYPVILLLLVAAIKDNDKIHLGICNATAFFGFLTVADVMTDLLLGAKGKYQYYNWPNATHFRMVLALGNVFCCLALFAYATYYVFSKKKHESLKIYEIEEKEAVK